jgi:ABC-type lipoprotein export system ATPase subunit
MAPTLQHATTHHHRLQWLAVFGGFLDGLKLEFGPGLNTVIGGRGTGKTTILELIRYTLDAVPEDPEAQKRIRALVAKNLDFGRVELGIQTSSGMSYIVSRSQDEAPVVLKEDRTPTDLVLGIGGLFRADIFSQNEVESIADRSDSQLGLIDSFDPATIGELTVQAGHLARDIDGLAKQMGQLQGKVDALRAETQELLSVEEQLKGLAGPANGDTAQVEKAHQDKALRDRERRAMDRVAAKVGSFGKELKTHLGILEQEARAALHADMLVGPNQALFGATQGALVKASAQVDARIQASLEVLTECWSTIQEQSKALVGAHGAQEIAYRELLEKQQTALGEATRRATLDKRRNDLMAKKTELDLAEGQMLALRTERETKMRQLAELRHQRFQRRHEICQHLTTALASSDIRVLLQQDGNKGLYRAKVDEMLRGSRVQEQTKERLVDHLFPAELVALVRAGDVTSLIDKAELTQPTAERVIGILRPHADLHSLETVDLVDQPKIELNDGGTWKDSKELSTGQKCTAILPILLMESEKPLLIDQPEDNLDNRYVSAKVVSTIAKVKRHRQLIFVTHNPNIPVLGDAEQVFVMDSTGTAAHLLRKGSVDDCRNEIVNLLEGGKKAFEQRAERYQR